MIRSSVKTRDVFLMQIAATVRRLRRAKGLSQKDLADLIGVSFTRISDLERGKGNPTLATLVALAEALGTSPRDLFDVSQKAHT